MLDDASFLQIEAEEQGFHETSLSPLLFRLHTTRSLCDSRMKLLTTNVAAATLLATASLAAPSPDQSQLPFHSAASLNSHTGSITSWISSSIASFLEPVAGKLVSASNSYSFYQGLQRASDEQKSIYDVIQERDELRLLRKAVNYSSDATKELLKGNSDEGKDLTFFAFLDPRKHHGHHGHHGHHENDALTGAWDSTHVSIAQLEQRIGEYEAQAYRVKDGDDKDDDEDKERRRRMLAHFIDSVLRYHLVESHKPLKSRALIDNSTVATKFSLQGKAAEIIGPLSDYQALRIRIGKTLVPKPTVTFNILSTLVYPDVELSNGVLHVVSAPIFPLPSILQGLFWDSPGYSTLTSALQKVDSAGYLALPEPHHRKRPNSTHFEGGDDGHKHKHDHDHDHGKHAPFSDPKGTPSSTLFGPHNLAWDRLPPAFRGYLFSPWGKELLAKVLMYHAIPNDLFYADAVHYGNYSERQQVDAVTHTDAGAIAQHLKPFNEVVFGAEDFSISSPGHLNVSTYVFDSVLPKQKRHHHHHGGDDDDDDDDDGDDDDRHTEQGDGKYETVRVEVLRYFLFPNDQGPIQTRVKAQGVPVIFGDVVHLNGANHFITQFLKPDHHPHKGIWAEVAEGAKAHGFGEVDLIEEAKKVGAEAW